MNKTPGEDIASAIDALILARLREIETARANQYCSMPYERQKRRTNEAFRRLAQKLEES